MISDERRLAYLLLRLRVLEQRDMSEHELPIVQVALAFLRRTIRELSHRLHDADYQRRSGDPIPVWPLVQEHGRAQGSEF